MAARKKTEDTKATEEKKPTRRRRTTKKAEDKPVEKKTTARKTTRRRSTKAKKEAEVKETKPTVEEEDVFDSLPSLGSLLWEYRARTAEWEKAYADFKFAKYKADQEKLKPIYKVLLQLIHEEEQHKDVVTNAARHLREIQHRAAQKLGITLGEFLSKCTVDDESGIVRYLDD